MTRLLLFHGVGLDGSVWQLVERRLGADLEVAAPDLPGHGGDVLPGPVTLADLVPSLDAPAHVVGFSLGGLVASRLAADRPELVQSLTLVSTVANRTAGERSAVRSRLARAEADYAASVATAIDRWDSAHGETVRRRMLANHVPSYLACYRVFAESDEEIWPLYPRLPMPVLAITGADDAGSTPAMSRAIAAAVPHGEARIVPGARHLLPLDRPDEVARAILDNIGRSRGDRRPQAISALHRR
jgi:pimeloyl-ACP methyl ester carboxylesterase